MERILPDDFSSVKCKNSSKDALQGWRQHCQIVKNRKRRFRFTANLSKREEAEALRRSFMMDKPRDIISTNASQYIPHSTTNKQGFDIGADDLGSIVEGHDVRKLKSYGGVEGIAKKLLTSTTRGISKNNESMYRRAFGTNQFTESQLKGFWLFVWEALQNVTVGILGLCALLSLIAGIVLEGWPKGVLGALGILTSILLVVFITATFDFRQSLEFKNLEKEKKKISIQVTRSEHRQNIPIYDLVPGDIVHLVVGDQVPADGLFVSKFSVLINESNLTGRSEPTIVNAENPFLLAGSMVQDGSCEMMVTAVGMRTLWATLMATVSEDGDDKTPLQVRLNGVATIIGKVGLLVAVVTFSVLAKYLLSHKLQQGMLWCWSRDDTLVMLEYFTIAITTAVVAVPEGMSFSLKLNFAFAMKNMMNNKALVLHRSVFETIGSATSICTDLRGTLTTNDMAVTKACICGETIGVGNFDAASNVMSKFPKFVVDLLLQSIFNNTSGEVVRHTNGEETFGTPTEVALLKFGLFLGGDFQAEREKSDIVKVEPFNSEKKRMGVVVQLPGGRYRAYFKGAVEIILAACDKIIDYTGQVAPLDDATLIHLKNTIDSFAEEALQILCLAYVEMGTEFSATDPIPFEGYTCIGIVGIKNTVRSNVKESVRICRSAGITVRMVTGENIDAAKVIAKECGILTDEGVAIEGLDFRQKNLEELMELIPKIQVIARSSPPDKHKLVKLLRTMFNEVVAMIGDGTNDAPALHETDIGLVMGSGTEMAKENSDVIILDDEFSTLATVTKWGRSVYMNVQKFLQFQLTVIVVALIANFSSVCMTGIPLFTNVQLIWINMITDTLGALALATESPQGNLMKRGPVGRERNFITSVMWRNILGQSLYQFIAMWYLQIQGKGIFQLDGPDSDMILNTLIFNSFVMCQVFNGINCRDMEKINVFRGLLSSHLFVAVLTCTVVFQIMIINFLGDFANMTSLTSIQWLSSVLIGFLGMPISAAIKMIPVG